MSVSLTEGIQTFSGNYFNFNDPVGSKMNIDDIAHALSNQCRFAGHVRTFYSVAQHSCLVSDSLPTPALQLAGLMHDAHEAYISDVVSPLKHLLPDYRVIEDATQAALCGKFQLDHKVVKGDRVRRADLEALATEKRDLLQNPDHWDILDGIEPWQAGITPWAPRTAYLEFLRRFKYLY